MLSFMRPETYALTAVAYQRHRLFQVTANAEFLLATLFRYRDQSRFLLHGFAIMPEHIHVLLTPAETIERAAQLIKGGYSFAMRKQRPGEIWQPAIMRIALPALRIIAISSHTSPVTLKSAGWRIILTSTRDTPISLIQPPSIAANKACRRG